MDLSILPFYENLTDEEKKIVTKSIRCIDIGKNQNIYNSIESCMGFIYVITGDIRVYITTEDSRQITLYRIKNNDHCVLSSMCILNDLNFLISLETLKDTKLLILDSNIFKNLIDTNIHMELFVYKTISYRFSDVVYLIENYMFTDFKKRLSLYLLDEVYYNKSDIIKTTHEEIAKNINSAREVVSKTLKNFERDGIISQKRGTIEILDKLKIKEYCD